jgi:predicted metal-dependent peptidase
MTTQTAERRIQKAHVTIMRSPLFAMYSGLLMVGNTSVRDDIPTACTDGRNKMYGRAFVTTLSDKELAFVIMHECLHVAFRHLTVWRNLYKQNAMLANVACDFVINLILVDADPTEKVVAMPMRDGKPFGCLDRKYKGMNSRQVFDLLKKEQEEGGGGGGGGSGPPTFDEHDWEGAQELTPQQVEELERDVDQALRQGVIAHQKLTGKNGTGNMPRELGDLLAAQINWKDALKEFAVATCSSKDESSWRRPNRRLLGQGIYMPSLVGNRVRRVVVGADMSGSVFVTPELINRFLSEVREVAEAVRPEFLDLLYWDTRVVGHETYESGTLDTLVSSTKPKGGGGTDPVCVEKYLEANNIQPDCIIILTDGYVSSWGSAWNAPLLWVIAGNPGCMAPTGKTIHIND